MVAQSGAMKMLEQMRNSTEAGIEIMTAEAERLEPITDRSHYMDIDDPRPLIASNDVSAADAALIQSEAQVGVGHDHA